MGIGCLRVERRGERFFVSSTQPFFGICEEFEVQKPLLRLRSVFFKKKGGRGP